MNNIKWQTNRKRYTNNMPEIECQEKMGVWKRETEKKMNGCYEYVLESLRPNHQHRKTSMTPAKEEQPHSHFFQCVCVCVWMSCVYAHAINIYCMREKKWLNLRINDPLYTRLHVAFIQYSHSLHYTIIYCTCSTMLRCILCVIAIYDIELTSLFNTYAWWFFDDTSWRNLYR